MKKYLIVVDMQNDFIDGALGTPEAQAIVDNVRKKIISYLGEAKEGKASIIYTQDTHYEDYLKTQEGKNLPVPHCIDDTYGWKIRTEIDLPAAKHLTKPTFGVIEWEDFIDYEVEEIELVGLCTDICVVSNAMLLKAFFPETKITVDASCCAGVTPETHKAALTTMKMCQINVIGE